MSGRVVQRRSSQIEAFEIDIEVCDERGIPLTACDQSEERLKRQGVRGHFYVCYVGQS